MCLRESPSSVYLRVEVGGWILTPDLSLEESEEMPNSRIIDEVMDAVDKRDPLVNRFEIFWC